MKKIPVLAIALFLSLFASATVITVNNNPNSPGQYTSLQQAIDSASAGDSIYVHGSATSYGNVHVKKRLNFFGTGNKPNKMNTLVSSISSMFLDTVSGISGASGSRIIGFNLNNIKGYSGTGGTRNILISRNYFVSGGTKINVTGSGWVIQNNIISSSDIILNNYSNIIIQNNIFSGSYISTSNQSTVVINNNVFLGNSYALISLSNALIANNIFKGATPNGSNVNMNTFSNNITYQTSNDIIPAGTNSGSGNLQAQDPMFTNVTGNSFSYNYDFTLAAGSPGLLAGTDGKDIGVFGGTTPFVDMTGTPAIPQVKSLTILNPVMPVGDSLKVVIKAKKQD